MTNGYAYLKKGKVYSLTYLLNFLAHKNKRHHDGEMHGLIKRVIKLGGESPEALEVLARGMEVALKRILEELERREELKGMKVLVLDEEDPFLPSDMVKMETVLRGYSQR